MHTDKGNDWGKMHLKGMVNILEEKVSSLTTTYYFDRNGFINKIVDEIQEIYIRYDTIGNSVEQKTYRKINNQLRLTKNIIFTSNFPDYIQFYNDKDEETSRTEFLYINNKISKELEYDNNQIHSYFEYKYDTNGNRTEVKKFNSLNELKLKNTYKFDSNNNKIEFSIYDWKTDKILETYKYTYDSKNEIIRTYIFDGNNTQISKSEYTYTYEFDIKGNWIYCVKYINNTKQKNTEINRRITYYD
jgi:hypothetical protein